MKDVQFEILDNDVFVNKEDTHLNHENEVLNAFVIFLFLVVLVNLFVLFLLKNKSRTLIDHMMLLDCVSNIGILSLFLTVINDI